MCGAHRVADAVANRWDMCLGHGGRVCGILTAVRWFSLKTNHGYECWVSPSLGFKLGDDTWHHREGYVEVKQFCVERVAIRCIF
jgi:hypothetical protein